MKLETKIVKAFFKSIGLKVKVQAGKTMECDMANGIIYIDKKWFENSDETIVRDKEIFQKIYKELGWKINVNMGTFAVLHELGHLLSLKTYKNYNELNETYTKQVNKLIGAKISDEERLRKYRNLKLEKDADNFAYVMYQLYEKQVIELDKNLKASFEK